MRIILADPPRREQHYDLSYANLGILYLIGSLKFHLKESVEVMYLEGHCTLQEHLDAIADFEPDLYGLSFALWTKRLAYRVMNEVKTRFPDLPVACGGAMPTAAPEDVLKNSRADLCVMGEGEECILDLAKYCRKEIPDLKDIAGIAFRNSRGEIEITEKRPFIADIDQIPMPAWSIVDFDKYHGMHIRKKSPQTHLLVSRGCPFDCNFCSNPVWKYNKPWLRARSASHIAAEIELLYGLGVREIYLSSDEFNFSETWALDVCDAIAALSHKDLYFQCNIRADIMTEDLALAFSRINLWMVHLGIESGNQRTLDGVGKKVTLRQISDACRVLKKFKIKVFGFVMLFHAWEENGVLCWESPADVNNTLVFCRKLLSGKLIDYMSWQVASPMPGSRLWKLAVQHNLLPAHDVDTVWKQNLMLPEVAPRDVQWALRKGIVLKDFYLIKNGNINWRHMDRVWSNLKLLAGLR